MAIEITMPQLSDTMDEGSILVWHKKEGERVSRGDILAEVSTDKADLEIESFHQGVLLKTLAPVGKSVKVGSVIAFIGEEGEVVPDVVEKKSEVPEVEELEVEKTVQTPITVVSDESLRAGDRIKISPLAKRLAETHGVDFKSISGTGEGGRIVRRDIEDRVGSGESTDSSQPLSKMRQRIAERMTESAATIPHYFVTSRVVVDDLVKIRESLKPKYEGITYNHLIIKAVAIALSRVPRVNCSFSDGRIVQPESINIGIITALPDGLIIPVLKNADKLLLKEVVVESRGLVERARAGSPKSSDLLGGTFSISNMGRAHVESFTAVINPGQGAILAVAPIEDEAVVVGYQVRPGKVLRLTLSVDHRIIDGVVAGEFMTELAGVLEEPEVLLA